MFGLVALGLLGDFEGFKGGGGKVIGIEGGVDAI